jgi:hypothetical protein
MKPRRQPKKSHLRHQQFETRDQQAQGRIRQPKRAKGSHMTQEESSNSQPKHQASPPTFIQGSSHARISWVSWVRAVAEMLVVTKRSMTRQWNMWGPENQVAVEGGQITERVGTQT